MATKKKKGRKLSAEEKEARRAERAVEESAAADEDQKEREADTDLSDEEKVDPRVRRAGDHTESQQDEDAEQPPTAKARKAAEDGNAESSTEDVSKGTDAQGTRVQAPGTLARPGTATDVPVVPSNKTAKDKLTARFLKLSGYNEEDIISSNHERRTFVTVTGGKYQVSEKGTKLRRISGPPTPRDLNPDQEDDDE